MIHLCCSSATLQNSTELEHKTIDLLIDAGPKFAGELNKSVVKKLVSRGLVYVDVPISDDDQISGNYHPHFYNAGFLAIVHTLLFASAYWLSFSATTRRIRDEPSIG